MHQIILGDCREELQKLPKESIDLCLTGPPFWREYWPNNRELAWKDGSVCHLGLEPTFDLYAKHLADVFDYVKPVLHSWFGSCWIVLQDNRENHSWSMIPQRFAIEMLDRGWFLRSAIKYKAKYDVLFFTKTQEYPFATEYHNGNGTTTLSGLALIRNHCRKDGIILDPFMGQGRTAIAAKLTGREYIGIELNKQRMEKAISRIDGN